MHTQSLGLFMPRREPLLAHWDSKGSRGVNIEGQVGLQDSTLHPNRAQEYQFVWAPERPQCHDQSHGEHMQTVMRPGQRHGTFEILPFKRTSQGLTSLREFMKNRRLPNLASGAAPEAEFSIGSPVIQYLLEGKSSVINAKKVLSV